MTCPRKPPRPKARAEGTRTERICWRLFTIQQAAHVADVPVERVCHWIMARKLRVYRLLGGLRVDELELADFLWSPESRRS